MTNDFNIVQVKKCLDRLNKVYPGEFTAMKQMKPRVGPWYISCKNYEIYMDNTFKGRKEALRIALKLDKVIFSCVPDPDAMIRLRKAQNNELYLRVRPKN